MDPVKFLIIEVCNGTGDIRGTLCERHDGVTSLSEGRIDDLFLQARNSGQFEEDDHVKLLVYTAEGVRCDQLIQLSLKD